MTFAIKRLDFGSTGAAPPEIQQIVAAGVELARVRAAKDPSFPAGELGQLELELTPGDLMKLTPARVAERLLGSIRRAQQTGRIHGGKALRFQDLAAQADYAAAIRKGALTQGGARTLEFGNGRSYEVGRYVGEGGNTVVYSTQHEGREVALRLINNRSDTAAVKAAQEYIDGQRELKRRGIPVVEIHDSYLSGEGTYDYMLTELFPQEVMRTQKLGTYFEELQGLAPEAREAERRSQKYQAFLEFVRVTAGLKKIGDFSSDHIVYHEGEWKVYDLSANHKAYEGGSTDEFNPRSTMWAKLYDVKAHRKGETSSNDLIDPATVAEINRTVQAARGGS